MTRKDLSYIAEYHKAIDDYNVESIHTLPELTLYLLSYVAQKESLHVQDVYDEINKKKQPEVSSISAVLVFLISYLNSHLNGKNDRKELPSLKTGTSTH